MVLAHVIEKILPKQEIEKIKQGTILNVFKCTTPLFRSGPAK